MNDTFDPMVDPDPETGRVGERGQAERARETDDLLRRMSDPADEYDGSHPNSKGDD